MENFKMDTELNWIRPVFKTMGVVYRSTLDVYV